MAPPEQHDHTTELGPHRRRGLFARHRGWVLLTLACALPLLINLALTVVAVNLVSSQSTRMSYASQAYFDTRYYDEVLTMSANMAAATGDPVWTQRYRSAQATLAASLDVALAETSGVELAELGLTSEANDALVAIEHEALAAVARGDLAAAQAIMASPQYAALKTEYADSVTDAEQVFQAKAERDVTWWTRLLALQFVMLILSMAWLAVVSVLLMRAWRRRALAESEQRYRLLAENATDVVFRTTSNGIVTWVSPAITDTLGWAPDEVLGGRVCDLVHAADRHEAQATVCAAADTSDTKARTALVRFLVSPQPPDLAAASAEVTQPGPEFRWASVRVTQTFGADGRPDGLVLGVRDVDDLVRTRSEMAVVRRAEERLRLYMESAAVGMAIASLDGHFVSVNPALGGLLGYAPAELEQRSLADITLPADRASQAKSLAEVAGGNATNTVVRLRLRTRDDNVIWVDLSLAPVRYPDGSVRHFVAQVVDVSAEVSNFEALKRSVAHYRLLAENASDVVYQTDMQGTIRWISPSVTTVLGWAPESLIGTKSISLVVPADMPLANRRRRAAYTGAPVTKLVLRFRCLDGQSRYMSVSARPLLGDDGMQTGVVVSLRDVTEEHLAQQELRLSEEQFRLAIDGAPQGVGLADAHGVFSQVNPALCELLGRSEADLVGQAVTEVLGEAESHMDGYPEDGAAGESGARHSHRVVTPDGEIWVEHSIGMLRDDHGELRFCVHQFTDATAARMHEAELERRATRDPLTGVSNRAEVMAQLRDRLSSRGEAGGRVGVLFCDVDNLKYINDAFGHACGDIALTAAADRLVAAVRGSDTVGRVGGDEFVVVMSHFRRWSDFARVVANIQDKVSKPVSCDGEERELTISVGATLAVVGDDPDQVVAHADQALYRAKQAGRNRVEFDPASATAEA